MLAKRLAAVTLGATLGIAGAVVAHFEGLETKAYKDPVGIPTICYGHTSTARLGQTKSVAECDQLLQGDLAIALADVDRMVKVPLPAERRAALTSFVYNVGGKKFESSTMLRKLNQGNAAGACAELSRWVNAGGKRLEGLVKRRAAERELCEVGL